MLTENRFYNYDDALAGIVDHLAKTPTGRIRNLSLLITDGSRPVASYDPKRQNFASSFMENISALKNPSRRRDAAQDAFDFHVYSEVRLGKLNATVVIDSLVTGTAAGMLHVIQDILFGLGEAQNVNVGTVYLFAVEASNR